MSCNTTVTIADELESTGYTSVTSIRTLINVLRSVNQNTTTTRRKTTINHGETIDFIYKSTKQRDDDEEKELPVQERLALNFLLLLNNLIDSYSKLDDYLEKNGNNTPVQATTTTRQKNKTPAPRGLLSIQDYTDIAILIEISVCASILPYLESSPFLGGEQHNNSRRNRMLSLPKSIKGRMPRSIDWIFAISKPCSSELLKNACCTLSKFLSVERFRPMFLPKYFPIVYSSTLYLEYHGQSVPALPSNVLNILLAQTCRSLLSSSSLNAWLKQRLSKELNTILQSDLPCLIHVFVSSAAAAADRTACSGAALRMAHVIQLSLKTDEDFERLGGDILALMRQQEGGDGAIFFVYTSLLQLLLPKERQRVVKYLIPSELISVIEQEDEAVQRMIQLSLHILASCPSTTDDNHPLIPFLCQDSNTLLLKRLMRIIANVPIFSKKDLIMQIIHEILTRLDVDQAVQFLVQTITPCPKYDFQCRYQPSSSAACRLLPITDPLQNIMDPSSPVLQDLQSRAQLSCDILQNLIHADNSYSPPPFVGKMFQFLLNTYLSTFTSPSASTTTPTWDKIVSMTLLPLLCETFSVEHLLQGDGTLSMIQSILNATADASNNRSANQDGDGDDNSLKSTACLCLSLLTALLELGNPCRKQEEEDLLTSMIPTLEQLSDSQFSDPSSSSEEAEMAEIAAHACALIASRKAIAKEPYKKTTTLSEQMDFIKQELQSTSPPERAYGVVQLLKIAKTITAHHDASLAASSNPNRPLITVLDQEQTKPNQNQHLLRTFVNLSLSALNDSESYVYLAAIQALVTISDTYPQLILPMLSSGLCRGTSNSTELTLDQRIKLAEALIFVIRRRGSNGIVSYANSLVTELVYGARSPCEGTTTHNNTMNDRQAAIHIQHQTHLYFQKGNDDDDDGDLDERQIRVKTGGPLYQLETIDVIRAGCLSCLAEICSILPPHVLAKHNYSYMLMKLCVDALQLDGTRPLRRAAAHLSKILYVRVLSEALENNGVSSIAVEMIHDESKLYHTLQQCVLQLDNTERNVYDPATVARCQEALSAREESEEMGVFVMAKSMAVVREREENAPTAAFVRKLLKEDE